MAVVLVAVCSFICCLLFAVYCLLFYVGRETPIHLAGRGTGSRNVYRLFRRPYGRWNFRSALFRLHGKFGARDYRILVLSIFEEETMKSAD